MLKKKKKRPEIAEPSDFGLRSDSFINARSAKRKRMCAVINVEAEQKVGKTDFALRDVPDPTIIFNHDNGLEWVIEQFLDDEDRQIIIAGDPEVAAATGAKYPTYQIVSPEDLVKVMKNKRDESAIERIRERAFPMWQRFVQDYYEFLENPHVRTGIIDTGGAAFQLAKLAFHGMSRGVTAKDDPYGQKGGEMKAIFKGLVSHGLNYDKNVIWLYRVKRQWVGGAPTDDMTLDGYDQAPYEVQLTLRLSKMVKKGVTTRRGEVRESRIYGDITNGMRFGGADQPELSFKSVMATVTATEESEWN